MVSISCALQESVIMDLQKKLKTLRYYTGECTGKMVTLQKACGIKETGKADKKTINAINKATAEKAKNYERK